MLEINDRDEIIYSKLISFKLVRENVHLDRFTNLLGFSGYTIEFQTHFIHPKDVCKWFNDVSITYPQKLLVKELKTKEEVEKFINKWVEINIDTIKEFEEHYKWLLN